MYSAVRLGTPFGSSHINDSAFEQLLVVCPGNSLAFQCPLELGVFLVDQGQLSLNRCYLLIERFDIGLQGCVLVYRKLLTAGYLPLA